MKKPTDIGPNRTGIEAHRTEAEETIRGAEEGGMSEADPSELIALHEEYARESSPVGTMPPAKTLKSVAKTAFGALKGEKVTVFLDKLGERLAFERAGTRLYEALLVKLAAADPHPQGPTADEVVKIRNDERRHFTMLAQAIRTLGGDPTAVTPCADVTAVASSGLMQVLTDSRTTLTQCLDTMLIAELADNDAWLLLSDMAEKLGQAQLAEEFREALAEEGEHLGQVRQWLTSAVEGEAGISGEDGRQRRNTTKVAKSSRAAPRQRKSTGRSARARRASAAKSRPKRRSRRAPRVSE